MSALAVKERTMVLMALGTGLRRSELFALKWKDVDFAAKHISVTRSIVNQVVGTCKTEASQKPVPLHSALAQALLAWRHRLLDFSPQDYLFASWYVVENVVFFVLLIWVAVIARRIWVYLIVLLYLPLPFLEELGYSHLNSGASGAWGWIIKWFVSVPHSILKFVPFLVLIIVLLMHKDTAARFETAEWPKASFASATLAIIVIAWSISAAKHFGGSEADRTLRDPGKFLLRVNSITSDAIPEAKNIDSQQSIYLLYLSAHRCILIDTSEFVFGKPGSQIRVLYVPPEKVKLIDGQRRIEMDPGHLFH